MRNEDFPRRVKLQALRRSGFRCERCRSSQNLEFHHRVSVSEGGVSDLNNCIVLCSRCHEIVPEDQLLLEMFIKFASPKEMINYYGVKTEIEAIEKWCGENNISVNEVLKKLNITSHKSSVIAGMEKKASRGELCGFNAPFGYKFKEGKLEIVEKEALTVKQIFDKYLSGRTLREIVKFLNSNEIKTKKNNKWSIWAVRRILKNPIYAGYIRWKNIVKKGKHTPISEPQRFNQVQMRMGKRAIRKGYLEFINDG